MVSAFVCSDRTLAVLADGSLWQLPGAAFRPEWETSPDRSPAVPEKLLDQVRAEQGEVYTILLSHRNNHYAQYAEARADLTLSGHAHGGLIRLPGTDGLIGPKRELWPAYTAGLYDLDYGQMVVSRGLGNQFPCFRLFNRPDVPLVVLE